jgi:hypothetical protein
MTEILRLTDIDRGTRCLKLYILLWLVSRHVKGAAIWNPVDRHRIMCSSPNTESVNIITLTSSVSCPETEKSNRSQGSLKAILFAISLYSQAPKTRRSTYLGPKICKETWRNVINATLGIPLKFHDHTSVQRKYCWTGNCSRRRARCCLYNKY